MVGVGREGQQAKNAPAAGNGVNDLGGKRSKCGRELGVALALKDLPEHYLVMWNAATYIRN